jgi:transposase
MGLVAELEELVEEEGFKLADYKNLIGVRGHRTGRRDHAVDRHQSSSANFGLVPRGQNSNETERSGHIAKPGKQLPPTALVQGSLSHNSKLSRRDSGENL